MNLVFSESGTPYIDFGNQNRLIFSNITKHPDKGYKYMVFAGGDVTNVTVSGSRAKKKKTFKEHVPINFTIDMDFKRDGKKGLPLKSKHIFSKITSSWLKKQFANYVVDGYFPENSISKLSDDINKLDEWEEVDDFEDGEEDF